MINNNNSERDSQSVFFVLDFAKLVLEKGIKYVLDNDKWNKCFSKNNPVMSKD